jgi:sulfite reductase (NADPH) flavoprotein alpha-component
VALDISGTGLTYQVGDALGIMPTNCLSLVRSVCQAAGLEPTTSISIDGSTRLLQEMLSERCLRSIPVELCERAAQRVNQRPKFNGAVLTDAALVQRLSDFADSDEFLEWDVCEFLLHFGPLDLTAPDLIETLAPLRPRLYSIASSQAKADGEVHLTVGRVEDMVRERARTGVASTMLAERLKVGASLSVFVQPHHGFTIPADPTAPMIMVGPGTGIAPFIAFLQQRACDGATGQNWLFFGDQKRDCDFLYRDQLTAWQSSGLLTRLDLAFSRDESEKVYVQHRMLEHAAELYRWLESGSYFFVCGDARRMARDVEQTLIKIVAQQGSMPAEAAQVYVSRLKQTKRYACDVY